MCVRIIQERTKDNLASNTSASEEQNVLNVTENCLYKKKLTDTMVMAVIKDTFLQMLQSI